MSDPVFLELFLYVSINDVLANQSVFTDSGLQKLNELQEKSKNNISQLYESEHKKAVLLFYEQNNIANFKKIFINQLEFAVKTYFQEGKNEPR